MVERLCTSAVEVGREVIETAKNETRWLVVAKGMVHAWNEGMASLASVRRAAHLKRLTSHIEAAGLSDPLPPEPPRRIGHSELLARRGSARRRRASGSPKTRAHKKR
jgi:serine/threonine-protein kinase HipA